MLGPERQSSHYIVKFLKFKMSDGRHVGKYSKYHKSPTNEPTGTQLGWSHPIMPPTCPLWCGCHGDDGRCLATAHCTFSSYGRLEGERMNQFWWNLVNNSKLRPQWQSRNQILKFLKFKMADSRHVIKYSNCHNSHHVPDMSAMMRLPTCQHWTFCSYGRLEVERMNQFW